MPTPRPGRVVIGGLGAAAFSGVASALAAGVALLTLARNLSKPLNRACAALFAVLAVAHLGAALNRSSLGAVAWMAAEGWLPTFALLFGAHLAQIARGQDRRVFQWAVRAAVLFGIAVTTVAVVQRDALMGAAGDDFATLPGFGKTGVALALLLHIAALIQIENVFRAARGDARYRIKYLVLGVVTLLAMRVYVLSVGALYGAFDPQADIETAVATGVGGAMVAYAVARHRLLDVDIFVSRYVIYNSIALAGTGAYLLIVGVSVYGLTHLVGEVPVWLVPWAVLLAVLALGVVLLSDAARWRVRHFVDRNFYKNRHDYRVQWQAVSGALTAERSADGMLDALARMAQETLGARYAGTLLKEPGAERYLPRTGAAFPGATPVRRADLAVDPDPAWHPVTGGIDVYRNTASTKDVLLLPLRFGDAWIGLLALGPRISGQRYHLEDLELVNAMAAQTAVAVRNLQLAQDLARSRETAALHQLSTFFIHDMKNVTNSLGLLARNIPRNRDNPEFWVDAEAGIRQAVDQMGTVMERLKELRTDAPPRARPIDLGALLERWVPEWNRLVPTRLECANGRPLCCRVEPDLLKSVFTNLVVNAAEAGATQVRVAGEAPDAGVRVTVTDDGGGMPPEFVARELFRPFASTKPQGMGIGLFQSRRIVEQFGGRLEAESRLGEGSRFTVTLPAADPAGGDGSAAPETADPVRG